MSLGLEDIQILKPNSGLLRKAWHILAMDGLAWCYRNFAYSLSDHPKPANEYHLKTGQRE